MARAGKSQKRTAEAGGAAASSGEPRGSTSGYIIFRAQAVPPWRIGRPKGTGMQRVYAQVREDIIALRLPPGADLDELSVSKNASAFRARRCARR